MDTSKKYGVQRQFREQTDDESSLESRRRRRREERPWPSDPTY